MMRGLKKQRNKETKQYHEAKNLCTVANTASFIHMFSNPQSMYLSKCFLEITVAIFQNSKMNNHLSYRKYSSHSSGYNILTDKHTLVYYTPEIRLK